MSEWTGGGEQADRGEAQCDPLPFSFDLLQFCFLDYGSSPPMKSCCSSFTTKPCPDGFYSCKQYLVSVVKCKVLLHQLDRCVAQLLSADAMGLQSLERKRKQKLPKSKALQRLTEFYERDLASDCSCLLSEGHCRPPPYVEVPLRLNRLEREDLQRSASFSQLQSGRWP